MTDDIDRVDPHEADGWNKPQGRTYQQRGDLELLRSRVEANMPSIPDPFENPDDPYVVEARKLARTNVPREITSEWVCRNSLRVCEEITRLRLIENSVDKFDEALATYASRGISTQSIAAVKALLNYRGIFKT